MRTKKPLYGGLFDGALGKTRLVRTKKPPCGGLFDGAPGRIRTPGPQIRSLVLYPAELPVHFQQIADTIGMALRSACGGT